MANVNARLGLEYKLTSRLSIDTNFSYSTYTAQKGISIESFTSDKLWISNERYFNLGLKYRY